MTEQQTPDREKKIAEIRKALEKATPWPWKWVDPGGLERKKLVGEWEIMNFGIGGMYDQVAGIEPDEDDAHLIVNAPEWLWFLLEELNAYKPAAEVFYERLQRLVEERDKLIEVLRWYADTKNYEYRTSYLDQDAPIIDDNGQRARDILREIGVTKDA